MDLIKWAISNYGTLSIIGAFLLGLVVKFRRYIANAIRSIHIGHNFHLIFGDSPAEKIKLEQTAIRSANEILEVRVSISEQWLKIGMYICDKTGNCTWTSDYLNNMFGLDSTEMLEMGWLASVRHSDRERVFSEWVLAVENKLPYNSSYTIVNSRDNLYIDVITTALAVVDANKNIHCYVGYLRELNRRPIKKQDDLSG